MGLKICIVGLGLMGASLAGALKGFKNADITGIDVSDVVTKTALNNGIVSMASTDIHAVAGADLVIFCVYAHHIPALLKECAGDIKQGAIISDICGVKTSLYGKIMPLLPDSASYVGLHPMTGKERDGIDNATPDLYRGSSMLICPTKRSTASAKALMTELAEYIGCARIKQCDYERHDAIIAYTSDLMHISAAGLCINYPSDMDLSFAAGAFRDCTRIADINAEAWTELLLDNGENVLHSLDEFIAGLAEIRAAIAKNDSDELKRLLTLAGDNKREMLKR